MSALSAASDKDGSLAAPVRYPTQLDYNVGAGMAVFDADGDGDQDVALATQAGVQIFHQTDAGTLTDAGVLPGTSGAAQVVAADVDADDPDLVMTGSSGVTLLTQESDGSFTPSSVTTDATREVEVGDLDGDGRPDVAGFQAGMVHVYHAGGGWNRTDHDTVRGYWPNIEGIEVADVTGDGRADVVATIGGNSPGSRLNVCAQNSGGGLDAATNYAVMDIPEPVEAADMNNDGRADVVTAHGGWNTLSVLPQQSSGTLGAPIESSIPYASHYGVQGLALGDINGDHRTDAVVADYNNGLVVLRNNSGPVVPGEQEWVRDVSPADFATGVARGTAPAVTFQRPLDPASVTTGTVRLVDGRTGDTVPTTPSYDPGTGTVTLTPAAALAEGNPYRIVVDGVRDTAGNPQDQPYRSSFATVDVAPGPVVNLKPSAAYLAVTLTWTLPHPPVRLLRPGDREPLRAHPGRHHQPGRAVDHPAGP